MTLRLRLLLALVGIVAIGLVVANVVTYTSLRSYLYSQVGQQLQTASGTVERVLVQCQSEQPSFLFSQGCSVPTNEYNQIPAGSFAELRDANGTVLYSLCFSGKRPAAPTIPSPLPLSQDAEHATVFSVANTGCSTASYSGIAIAPSGVAGDATGPYEVVVAIPLTSVDQTLGRLLVIEILVSLAVLAALGALVWWVVRRGLRPLEEMATTAGAIAAGDLSRRVTETDTQSEVGKLGAALNKMLAEIESAFAARAASEDRLRRFLADASHELRTPLTSIRGYAELFDRGARENPDDLETSMRHIREDANRMSVLVDDLLLLARLDHQRPLERTRVDFAEIATSAVDATRVSAPDREIALETPADVELLGDGNRLRQVLDNLLANAVRHTPEGTPIEVRVREDPLVVGVEVVDHGPGIPPSERDHIFEPFHRADPSRARSSGGVGLGLAIVLAIAHAHGGRVGVVSDGVHGSTFWVQLPRNLEAQTPTPEQADHDEQAAEPPSNTMTPAGAGRSGHTR